MLVVGPAAVTRQPLAFLHDDRTAVIEHRAAQIDRRLVLHQMRVHGVAAGEHPARHQHDVADLQRRGSASSVSGALQRDLAAGPREARLIEHRDDRVRRIAIQPAASIAPVDASSTTPRRRNAQQSYATDTKKLAGSRLSAPILQPISVTLPPKPIVPISRLFTVAMIDASSSASRGSGFTSSSVRNSCSFACV